MSKGCQRMKANRVQPDKERDGKKKEQQQKFPGFGFPNWFGIEPLEVSKVLFIELGEQRLKLTKGHSENRTRDLSQQKRESYH